MPNHPYRRLQSGGLRRNLKRGGIYNGSQLEFLQIREDGDDDNKNNHYYVGRLTPIHNAPCTSGELH